MSEELQHTKKLKLQETKESVNASPELSRLESGVKKILAAKIDEQPMKRLAHICDNFGARLSGSSNLEKCIDWIAEKLKEDGFENVHTEDVKVPVWHRGQEYCKMTAPVAHDLNILGIGGSVGTEGAVLNASVICVKDFKELDEKKDSVSGKIVCYNCAFTTYGETVAYRRSGASRASAYGAIGVIVRSVTPVSLNTPHTGMLVYEEKIKPIPAVCCTLEDAEWIQRLSDEHTEIVCSLYMEAETFKDEISRNIIADFPFSSFSSSSSSSSSFSSSSFSSSSLSTLSPSSSSSSSSSTSTSLDTCSMCIERAKERKDEEFVVVGGHTDSWDVGQGAHDDAQGIIVAWEAIRLLKSLHLPMRRTLRFVGFVNEENGARGGSSYASIHEKELSRHQAVMETDLGAFQAIGFGFTGTNEARKELTSLSTLLKPISADQIVDDGGGVDIRASIDKGVPGLLLRLREDWWNRDYFLYHHSGSDTIDKIEAKYVKQNIQAIAAMIYCLAEMKDRLPNTVKA
eukprot:TRINITY_DN251_c6_g1_i1.p1 TRINITY_DN251_c6_g1~~TRINITY_DN251_c6_g1_i1.p1  ORF type:complete len:515 (+),score=190.34 TRINITY_DN251_c6_g1_i1:96-1640(+)